MNRELRLFVFIAAVLGVLIFGIYEDLRNPSSAQAAVHRPIFAAQTETGDTPIIDVSQQIGDWVTATAQIESVGSPSGCTYQVLGRVSGATTFHILGETSDCTAGAMFHLANKPVDEIKGHLELTGGTSARLHLKLVTR